MDYEARMQAIQSNFIMKMAQMYQAPKHIKDNKEHVNVYCKEIREAINKRLDSRIPNVEVLNELLDKIWDKCISENTYRLYFTPALVMKHTTKVNSDYQQRQAKADKMFEEAFTPKAQEQERPRSVKTDAVAGGWTIENCNEHIANMEGMIERGEINRYMGQHLMSIPKKAKERLLKAGQTE